MFIGHFGIGFAAKNNSGKYGLIALILFLVIIQAGNTMGPPPPDVEMIAWAVIYSGCL